MLQHAQNREGETVQRPTYSGQRVKPSHKNTPKTTPPKGPRPGGAPKQRWVVGRRSRGTETPGISTEHQTWAAIERSATQSISYPRPNPPASGRLADRTIFIRVSAAIRTCRLRLHTALEACVPGSAGRRSCVPPGQILRLGSLGPERTGHHGSREPADSPPCR